VHKEAVPTQILFQVHAITRWCDFRHITVVPHDGDRHVREQSFVKVPEQSAGSPMDVVRNTQAPREVSAIGEIIGRIRGPEDDIILEAPGMHLQRRNGHRVRSS